MDIDMLNVCLKLGLVDERTQQILDYGFEQIHKFTSNHLTTPDGYLAKSPLEKFDRAEMIDWMLSDMYKKIQNLED